MQRIESILARAAPPRAPVIGIFLIAAIVALYFGKDFLLPVALAYLVAMTFRPAIKHLSRRGVPAWVSAAGFMCGLAVLGLAAAYALIRPLGDMIAEAPSYAQTFALKIRGLRSSLEGFVNLTQNLENAAAPLPSDPAPEVVLRQSALFTYLGEVTGYSAGVAATLILTFVLAGFLMASGDLFYAKLVHVMPKLGDKKRALRIVYDVEREVSSYLLIVTAINAGLGLAVALVFGWLGMPMPYLWGFLAFLLNYLPYVGSIMVIVLSAFMAVVTFNSFSQAMLVPVSFAIINGIENQFVSPYLLGRRLQLNAVAIILAMAFWTWLWGISGTLIAVPLLVTFKVFCDHIEGLSAVGEFLSAKHPEDREPAPNEAAV